MPGLWIEDYWSVGSNWEEPMSRTNQDTCKACGKIHNTLESMDYAAHAAMIMEAMQLEFRFIVVYGNGMIFHSRKYDDPDNAAREMRAQLLHDTQNGASNPRGYVTVVYSRQDSALNPGSSPA